MTECFSLWKVRWQDGDVITEKHLRALERWTESLYTIVAFQGQGYGLLRYPDPDLTFNDNSGIVIKHVQGAQYLVNLSNFLGVTSKGRLVIALDPPPIELIFKSTERDTQGYFHLFILPAEGEGRRKDDIELDAGKPTFYQPAFRLHLSDGQGEGICLARLKVDGKTIHIDQDFVPLSYTLNGSPSSVAAFNHSLLEFKRVWALFEQYYQSQGKRKPVRIEPILLAVAEIIRLCSSKGAAMSDENQVSRRFFLTIQSFFDGCASELRILGASDERDSEISTRLPQLAANLTRIAADIHPDISLTRGYRGISEGFEQLVSFFGLLPDAPPSADDVKVKSAAFSRGNPFNKLILQFENEVVLGVGTSKLVIRLRNFSMNDPSTWDIRPSLVDKPWGGIDPVENSLVRTGEEFDYQVEVTHELAKGVGIRQLIIYLPVPLGENIENHRAKISAVIRS
jgi:hypothetical protein